MSNAIWEHPVRSVERKSEAQRVESANRDVYGGEAFEALANAIEWYGDHIYDGAPDAAPVPEWVHDAERVLRRVRKRKPRFSIDV